MPKIPKRYIFLVQGEGRGHMTQAMGLYQMLSLAGHEICHIFIGKSNRRKIPDYFISNFKCQVEPIQSPNFISDRENKAIRLIPSLFFNLWYIKKYIKNLNRIHQIVKEKKTDAIINFYDFLGGFYNFLYRPSAKFIVIGHQFLASHPAFEYAKGHVLDNLLFRINNRLMSLNAYKKIALSFTPYQPSSFGRTTVAPPILRKEIFSLKPTRNNFFLCYMVNEGYAGEIIQWHNDNPDIILHCFWDGRDKPEIWKVHKNLTFHQLNAKKYLTLMSQCNGLVTTAGFESVCEAMYLGKPVLMIPVAGQYEQACNALDAQKAGAGIFASRFNISLLINYLPGHRDKIRDFHQWIDKAQSLITGELSDF